MAKFHTVTVTNIKKTIRDAVVLTLQPDDINSFDFTQGQYLTFRQKFDGEELRRSYSICSSKQISKQTGSLQVGIKRVDGGAFSTWANTELKIGDTLEAMPPMGNFFSTPQLEDNLHYLGFAAGSGITPILSIIRTVFADDPTAKFTLVYANRNINTIMFREELEDLKNLNMGRLNIIHILDDEAQAIDLFSGCIDANKCAALFKQWIDLETITCTYICGPEQLMKTIERSLLEHGQDKSQIRFELFASGQQGRAKKRASSANDASKGVRAKVTLDGESRSFTMTRDTSLLEAAVENTVDAPFACKAGICSTCKAKVTSGEVEMIANHSLEDYEVQAGFVLTCQSYPVSEKVTWNYDDAGH